MFSRLSLRMSLVAAPALALMALLPGTARAGLSEGDPAPKFAVKQFVKGEAVKALKKGHVWVVEFWSTTCDPSRAACVVLTSLQQRYPKDVTVIGVAHDKQAGKVKQYVKDMGVRIDYRIALDAGMKKTWQQAANRTGTPTVFLVGADGVVSFIGHPRDLEGPLADAVNKSRAGKKEAP